MRPSDNNNKSFRLAETPTGSGQVPVPLSTLPDVEKERIIKGKISELNFDMLGEIDRLERMQECAEAYIETLQNTIKDLEKKFANRDMMATYFYNVLRLVLPRYKPKTSDKPENVALILKAKAQICPTNKTAPSKNTILKQKDPK